MMSAKELSEEVMEILVGHKQSAAMAALVGCMASIMMDHSMDREKFIENCATVVDGMMSFFDDTTRLH